MPRKRPTAVPPAKFFGKYWKPLLEAEDRDQESTRPYTASILMDRVQKGEPIEVPRFITTRMLWDEVEHWWPIRMLREAAKENDGEGFKRLLDYFLLRLRVKPPRSVLIPFRWQRGRPEETEMIYDAWVTMGRPTTQWRVLDELAKMFYADQFASARSDTKLRKNLRDRIRATIRRHEARAVATKTRSIA